MKKTVYAILICCMALTLALCLASCGNGNQTDTPTPNCETGHTFADATCTAPKTCSVCGETEGEKAAHTYDNACDAACNVCGETRTAEHTGGTATCKSGKLCEVCGVEYTDKNTENHTSTEFIYIDNGDGTHSKTHECGVAAGEPEAHDFGTDYLCIICGTLSPEVSASITEGSVTVYYSDLHTAVNNWTDGTTMTLLADVQLTERITATAKGLILDLNGHKIECSDTFCTIWIDDDSSSDLTIRDSKEGGYVKGEVYIVATSKSRGTLRLESGTIQSVMANGDFIMTGGTIRNEEGDALRSSGDYNITISGGEIYGIDNGILSTYGALITITGNVKITGKTGYALRTDNAVISGTPTIVGGKCEFCLSGKITLNAQPANGEVWRVRIVTDSNSGIEAGVFAIPGEGVTLDASKFASAMDGYEVKKNDKGELLLCNHAVSYHAVASGDGTHNMTCWCGGTVLEANLACSGGMATDTILASCQSCGAAYGELDPNFHYDIYTANMTEEELQTAVTELLLDGQTKISIFLADADAKMLAAIDAALNSSGVDKDNVKLTFGSQNAVQNENQFIAALRKGGIITLMADITLTGTTDVKKNTTIALNGYTLTPAGLGLNVKEGCTLTVIGDGTVNGDDGLWVLDGVLNLHGGTIERLFVCDTCSTVNIFGGKITTLTVDFGSTVNIFGGYVGKLNYYEGTLIITGGTFGFDPSAYVDTTNYTVTKADGVWTVTKTN